MACASQVTTDGESTSKISEVSRSSPQRRSHPIHTACREGDLEQLRALVEQNGSDLDARDTYGRTAMHWACEEGHLEVLQYLIECGADIRIPDGVARTPMHWACFGGHLDCVRYLRKNGAHINAIDCEQKTPLYLACTTNDNLDVVRYLTGEGANIHTKTKYQYTALQIAAKRGYLPIVQHLVKSGAKINFENIYYHSPLTSACLNGHVHVAQYLIKKGAKMHKNILHNFYDKAQVTTLLIENGANLNTINRQGETVLHLACEAGKVAVVRALLAHRPPSSPLRERFRRLSCGSTSMPGFVGYRCGVDINAIDRYQRTALHRACEKAQVEVARLLVEHNANVTVADVCGRTPLHWACEAGNVELTRLLLSHGANTSVQDGEGESPLMWAAEGGHTHVARLLVQHHSDIAVKSEDGRTALHWAVEGGHLEIVRLLIQYGAYAHVVDEYGWNLLHRACIKGHLQVVKCLVQHRADVQSVDGYGRTSLHWSCKVANMDVSVFLIEHGADVTAVDWGMRTPLHWVCGGGLLQVQSRQLLATLLIRKGASVHALDMQQCTPLHLACKGGLLELTSCLINLGAFINSNADSGKAFILELLNKFVKKYILSNILQENAIVPMPPGGTSVDIQLAGDLNTMQTVEPERIHMFYLAGFQFSRLINFAQDLRRRDQQISTRWSELLEFLTQRECQIHSLTHLCRLNIRGRLGRGIKNKVEKLSIYIPPNSANSHPTSSQHCHDLLKLPTQLKDYLTISEINN